MLIRLSDAQVEGGEATVALTGGGVGTAILAGIRSSPLAGIVDWSKVQIWWSDDRYVAKDQSDRNELQARNELLDHLGLPEENIHAMPAGDGRESVENAATRFSDQLLRHSPTFDVVLLGVGPDGHVASIFPSRQDLIEATTPAVAVRRSPKPPAERISLSLQTINSATEVWLVAAGAEKADAIKEAQVSGSPLPAARVRGRERTLWLVDRAAALGQP